jgi:hypothetical protein
MDKTTVKTVKNEQWTIVELVDKIVNKDISKPKFQRKKKWDIQPKKENNPNERKYIDFLYVTKNSVHPITFGDTIELSKITNIDGNNRINAVKHFIDKPFEIYPEYLTELFDYINVILKDDVTDREFLLEHFMTMPYHVIILLKFNKHFDTIDKKELYTNKLKLYRDEFEGYIDNIQSKLKINTIDRFDTTVKINVNLFHGYSTDELCKIFEDINKFDGRLTEIELLACRLHSITDFKINNNVLEISIINEIINYYKEKSNNEVLTCFQFDNNDQINAYDFVVAFQNYCSNTYQIIEKTDNNGLSLFFKLYKNLYNGFDNTFNSENINDFIDNIIYSCVILQKIYNKIFTTQINDKLFNKTCETKFLTLKKNNLYIIISSIIGYKKMNEKENIIINSIEKSLFYHFFVSDLSKDNKNHKIFDTIRYEAGGKYIDNVAKNMLKEPSKISKDITDVVMTNLVKDLLRENNAPIQRFLDNGKKKNDKRKPRSFFEKCLLFYYYKEKVPVNFLNNKFSIEHIFPFSSTWSNEIDIERIGNIVPIINEINNKRNNKHISEYIKLDNHIGFIKFIDVIPSSDNYDNIISHNKSPTIFDNDKYNELCESNEMNYLNNFIKCLY